ncbi:hypothetical protein B1R32_102197 [Abditibacterium utsteinense]|uniref:Uncharacterized protein n=1 Tax=Abditibacterium utsteinense TaxID=1960156 RepID=A0A2S8SWL3_9BACT|nr:hypothetical protein [Abditibacterium utsteinense]PQV65188.1 hypothetical protein B1R32_102197 [Abditibacterium utsteinense]
MRIEDKQDEFPPDIRAAFDEYSLPRPSPTFEAHFWTRLEARRTRYRGVTGFCRRMLEIEIEGVMVWRLAASTLSGGASCALLLMLALGFASPKEAPLAPAPLPRNHETLPAMGAFAFYNRQWEDDFFSQPQPKPAPQRAKSTKNGGDFSWNGSNAHLA